MLDRILEKKIERLETLAPYQGEYSFPCQSFSAALKQQNQALSLIAEIKPISPRDGVLRDQLNVPALVKAYETGGAAALSVLTEEDFFGGSLNLLTKIRKITDRPLLCKDFVIDLKQPAWMRAAGADACLLILAALDFLQAKKLKQEIERLDMQAIIEIHTQEEYQQALLLKPEIILINQRNLRTLEIIPDVVHRLASQIPKDIMVIAASGYHDKNQINALPQRVDAILIGSHLMQQEDPALAIRELLNAH